MICIRSKWITICLSVVLFFYIDLLFKMWLFCVSRSKFSLLLNCVGCCCFYLLQIFAILKVMCKWHKRFVWCVWFSSILNDSVCVCYFRDVQFSRVHLPNQMYEFHSLSSFSRHPISCTGDGAISRSDQICPSSLNFISSPIVRIYQA